MADDVTVDNGALTDYVVAADDVGSGTLAQIIKLAYSADGTRTLVTADANGLAVSLAAAKVDDAGFTIGTDRVIMIGGVAVAHGTNPDAADALDAGVAVMNRHRIPFQIGGHPNSITASARITSASTDTVVITGTIAGGLKVVITRLSVNVSNATTVNVGIKVGFSTTTLPADSATGAAGVIIDNDGWPPGGGINLGDGSGIIAIGGDGEELRVTNDVPTSGAIHISATYYTIES